MGTARATVELVGNNTQAVEAIEETQDALGGLGETAKRAGTQVSGGVDAIGRLSTGVIVANQGIELLQRGFRVLEASTQAYFERTQQGEQMWSELVREGRQLKGLLFELVIGSEDSSVAFERLRGMLQDLVSVGRAGIAAIQPLADLLRIGLGGALGIAADAARLLTGDLADSTSQANALQQGLTGLTGAQQDVNAELEALLGANDRVSATYELIEEYARLAADAIVEQTDVEAVMVDGRLQLIERNLELTDSNEQVRLAQQRLREELFEAILTGERLDEVIADVSSQATAFGNASTVVRLRVDSVDEALRQLTTTVGDGQLTSFFSLFGALQELLEDRVSAEDEATEANNRGAQAERERARALQKRNDEQARALALLQEDEAKRKDQDEADRIRLGQQKVLEQQKLRDELIAQDARRKAAAEEEQAARDQLKLSETIFAREQELANQRRQLQQQSIQGALSIASAFGSTISDVVTGQEKGGKAVQKFFGDVITIAGQIALAQAAMRVFQMEQGGPAAAIGLAIAGGAAIALGRALGSTRGGGRGAAPTTAAAAPQQTNITNNNYVSNIGRVGSYEAYLQMIGEDYREAESRGHIGRRAVA